MVECLFERLYLAKDDKDSSNDVYVEKCPFVQHQLDGIRFMYKAYKKKKPGVILNDPSGYGKRVQTTLFLSAVLPILDKPVVILCKEGRQQLWLDSFLKWTQVSDDVSMELTNPFIKKKVLVTPSYNAATFARRDWSVIVVDDSLSKDLLKATLRAGLRVWITSANVKEDLFLYSTFHSWITPKDKFSAEKFKAKADDLRDVIAKTVMLDAYLEDTVLRRTSFNTPFLSTQVPIQAVETQQKARVTKKNKDATGTKIKRTKRKSVDTNNAVIEYIPRKVARIENVDKNRAGIGESKKVEENSEGFKTGVSGNDEDLTDLKCKRNNKHRFLWDSDSEDDNNVTKLQENNKINTYESQSQQPLHYDSESDCDSHRDAPINIPNELNNTRLSNTTENNATITIDGRKDSIEDNRDEIPNNEMNNEINLEIPFSTVNAKEVKNDKCSKLVNTEESGSLIIINEINHKSQNTKDDNHKISNEVKNDIKFSEDLFSTDICNINGDEIIKKTTDGLVKKVTENENEKTDQVKPDIAALSSFELKLKQLEELTLKKFKGTFFDSIF